ncbi:hypothetical protein BAE44_0001825 [Dichanthelium oligosanthes]|uniref:Uncharacterized protein n=1 Tax=Dichanthelium oligosanthes TaxID=888268 RepID=A0A1E5WIJ0_9POAL|nr:hypothetical protein BAE44_0001825 [Dichanthelium oligosanthes]
MRGTPTTSPITIRLRSLNTLLRSHHTHKCRGFMRLRGLGTYFSLISVLERMLLSSCVGCGLCG